MAQLDPNITPAQLSDRYGGDDDSFSLLAVAEAVLNRVPSGVSLWLSSPEVCMAWEEILAVQEGNHQLSWWCKMVELGIEHSDTLRADRRLARIRQRRAEAHLIMTWLDSPSSGTSAQTSALRRLLDAHAEEAELLIAKLLRSSGIDISERLTPDIERLLDLDDQKFRDLVARDVQRRVDTASLGHPAVLNRWYEALVELGTQTFAGIGLDAVDQHLKYWFAVPDRHLIQARHEAPIDEWVPKLTFLTHLRARLMERNRLHRHHNQRSTREVMMPVERQLMETHYIEYARYRCEEADGPTVAIPRPPHPAAFDEHAAALDRNDWDVKWIFDGRRIWLDAWGSDRWHEDGRLIVTSSRSRAGKSAWKWAKPNYVFFSRRHRRYVLLTGSAAFADLAESNPKSAPHPLFKSIMPHDRERLETFIPPDGFRWRHPYPPGLTDLTQPIPMTKPV
ncbi:hypothetical protein [Acrocarpospora macrocephala]|uniref:hypothetical protein n=1 Tax=Acrocarpospora macrocephala TaxID=150177 RepID=UPI0012D31F26|nr:hypothetical protein [Acrocarpospora macrocephala]